MSAAVIGADGFIGSALGMALSRHGVPALPFTRARSFLDSSSPAVTGVDTIYWLASNVRPATAGQPQALRADQDAVRTLLDLIDAAPARGRCRVVVVSSGGTVYDPGHPPPHSESTPVRPANAYGQAMLDLEQTVRARAPEASILRVSNAYGPGQRARRGQGVIAYWLDSVIQDRPGLVIGAKTVARDYIYVDDVAEALVAVHYAPIPPDFVNIGSGQATMLGELLAAVRRVVAPTVFRVEHEPSRGFDAPSTWLDVGLAETLLDWRPTVGLLDGLGRTWRARQNALVRTPE